MTTKLHFAKIWESNSSLVPNEPALFNNNKTIDWRSFDELSSKLASYLIKMGLGEDSKVGIYMQNCNEYMIAQFAAFKIGAVPINVNYRYKKDELIYLFDNSDAEAIIFQSNFHQQILLIQNDLPKVKAFVETSQNDFDKESTFDSLENIMQTFSPLDHQDRSEDEIYMIYTGGTTGMPKGVVREHGGVLMTVRSYIQHQGIRSDDTLMSVLSLGHANAQAMCLFAAIGAGCTAVFFPKFSASNFWIFLLSDFSKISFSTLLSFAR